MARETRKTEWLRGKPLTSRRKWIGITLIYVAGCVVGAFLVLTFLSGVALAIGLTIVAFFAGGLFELFGERYSNYRKEWEAANPGTGERPQRK